MHDRTARFTRFALGLTLGLAVGLPACSDDNDDQDSVRAVTFNMYFGFDFTTALTSPPAAFAQFQRTDAAGRIIGLARFLTDEEPDFVGLQEVMQLTLTQGTDSTADDVQLADFVSTLTTALQNTGGPAYQAFEITTITVPGSLDLGQGPQPFVFRAKNVILVHPDWSAQAVGSGIIYQTLATLGPLTIQRGAHHVRATRAGTSFELFNTHLESVSGAVATAQAVELAAYVHTDGGGGANTTLLFGDLNATPTDAAISAVTGAGMTDSFAEAGTGSGFSCCQTADLDNTTSTATQRIDYLFVESGTAPSAVDIDSSELVLDSRVQRSDGQGQIWPSDHFGFMATLEFQ